jgi:phage-related protein
MQAKYYRTPDGEEPVSDFIESLRPVRKQAAIDNQIDRLNDLRREDPPLAFPHTSQIKGQLRELRCHYGNQLYRILYRRSDDFFVLLHMFRKDTGQVPAEEIRIAEKRWADFKARMDAPRRVPPRAIGKDAPS